MSKSLNRRVKRLIVSLLITLLLSVIGVLQAEIQPAKSWLVSSQPGLYLVNEVSDGDTFNIMMNGRSERVRMIGVDTPELHHPEKPVQCFAEAAKQFTARLIGGQQVRLEADHLDDNRDLYGRLLRYVYLTDGRLVNAEIIKEGYGFAYTRFPHVKSEELQVLESEARLQQRGLWSGCQIHQNQQTKETNFAE